MRTFVGLWPTAPVSSAVAGLHRPPLERVRWTGPDQWHATLRFCGEVPDDHLTGLVEDLTAALGSVPPFDARLGATTTRLGERILAVLVDGLDDLASVVADATRRHGDHAPEPTFTGHLTLARARPALPAELAGRPVDPVVWSVDAVAVVASTRDPSGASYRTAATIGLGGVGPDLNRRRG